jgi:hypothetical protein
MLIKFLPLFDLNLLSNEPRTLLGLVMSHTLVSDSYIQMIIGIIIGVWVHAS